MTAWFGDGAYSYSGILHLPAPFPAIIDRLRERTRTKSPRCGAAAIAHPPSPNLYLRCSPRLRPAFRNRGCDLI
jgi:hypothetical protein